MSACVWVFLQRYPHVCTFEVCIVGTAQSTIYGEFLCHTFPEMGLCLFMGILGMYDYFDCLFSYGYK